MVPLNSVPSFYLTLLNLSNLFQTEILNHFRICSHIVNVFDLTQLDFMTISQSSSVQNITNIILPASLSNNASVQLPYLPTKFSSPCAFIVQDITDFVVTFSGKNIEPEEVVPWEPPALLGSPLNEFHVFSIQTCDEELLSVARPLKRKIYRSFIVQFCEDSLHLFRLASDGQSLLSFGELPTKFSKRILVPFPNFNSEPFNIVTCGTCPKVIPAYKITGTWSMALVGLMYEFSILINGTFEAEEVLSYPRDGQDEDGEWDAWFQPVIDGSAAVTLHSRVTAQKSHLAYITVPVTYDGIVFITAKPKRVPGSQSLLTLFAPLKPFVWIACGISVIFMFIIIELAIEVRRRRWYAKWFDEFWEIRRIYVAPMTAIVRSSRMQPTRHLGRLTLAALMKPMVEQGALDSSQFVEDIRDESLHRFLLAIWFLGAIVLVNGYTSEMTSMIVQPAFTSPPTTFIELADSNYDLSAFAWTDNFEVDFKTLNASYIQGFVERVNNFSPMDPDCYVSILNDHTACIGASKVINFRGVRFIVDANGEPLFKLSKEVRFPFVLPYAVSHFYPLLYEPLNRVVESFWESGLIGLWETNNVQRAMSVGKEIARRLTKSEEIKNENDGAGEQNYLSGFLVRIILFGYVLATAAYIQELFNIFVPLFIKKAAFQFERFITRCRQGMTLDF